MKSIVIGSAFTIVGLVSAQAQELPTSNYFDWSGFYAGIVGGGGMFDAAATFSYSNWAPSLGVVAGATVQDGALVYGLEGDLSWTNYANDPAEYEESVDWQWFGTLRARAGLAIDDTLLFASGGLAVADARYEYCNDAPECSDYDEPSIGLAAGIGLEHAVSDQLTGKVEYMFVGLPSAVTTGDAASVTFSSSSHLIRAGLNWHAR